MTTTVVRVMSSKVAILPCVGASKSATRVCARSLATHVQHVTIVTNGTISLPCFPSLLRRAEFSFAPVRRRTNAQAPLAPICCTFVVQHAVRTESCTANPQHVTEQVRIEQQNNAYNKFATS